MSEFIDDCRVLLLTVSVFLLSKFLIVITLNSYGGHSCNGYQEMTGKQTLYRQFDSCYVNVDGEWRKYDEHLAIITAKYSK